MHNAERVITALNYFPFRLQRNRKRATKAIPFDGDLPDLHHFGQTNIGG